MGGASGGGWKGDTIPKPDGLAEAATTPETERRSNRAGRYPASSVCRSRLAGDAF